MVKRKTRQLNERHRRVLGFVERYQNENGYPPTVREIGNRTGINSTSLITYYLERLEVEGYIERDEGVSRGIRILKPETEPPPPIQVVEGMLRVAVTGPIQAGSPITIPASDFSIMDYETTVDVPVSLLPRTEYNEKLFALQVKGDSMIDALVNEGDYVILRHTQEASNGDMVAAWLKSEEQTTLKRFYREGNSIRLQPANPNYQPIVVSEPGELEVQGKVMLVIRPV